MSTSSFGSTSNSRNPYIVKQHVFLLLIFFIIKQDICAQDANQNMNGANADSLHKNIAKQLQNPVANLISIPFQSNFEFKAGPNNGFKYTLNFQPVIPLSLGNNWNLITRAIVPVVSQIQVVREPEITSTQSGISDILFSAFLSPKESEITWGIGPALLFPSATNSFLGAKKWAAGPTGIILQQSGSLTTGLLANHVWSYAGDDTRSDISSTFLQPFVSYVNKSHTTFSLSSESSYDWRSDQWVANVIPTVSQLTKLINLPTNFALGVKYYFAHPALTPVWGIRAAVILVMPG